MIRPAFTILARAVGPLTILACCCLSAAEAPSEGPEVDPQIFKILLERCWECHNNQRSEGGLSLETPSGLRAGGFSGQPLLAESPADNELLKRVNSDDPADRMPKGQPPLHPVERKALQAWLAHGAPWPDEQIARWNNRHELFSRTFWARFGRTVASGTGEVPHARTAIGLLLVMLLAILVAAVYRRRTGTGAEMPRWQRWLASWGPLNCLLAGLLVATGFGSYWLWLEYQQAASQVARMQVALRTARHPAHTTAAAYGSPPRPGRPFRPKRLGATYYQGNLERHPALFNGGNYRTAAFRLSLADEQERKIQVGDAAPEKVFVRLELIRAPGQSDAAWSDAAIGQLLVSAHDLSARAAQQTGSPGSAAPLPDDCVRFRSLESGRRWVAEYPLAAGSHGPDARLEGLLYVYRARRDPPAGTPLEAQFQYGIVYVLAIAAGRLTADSDLWMGPLYCNPNLALPQPGVVPLQEWFDDRPLPQLPEGSNVDPYAPGGPAPFADFGVKADDD